MDWNAGLLKNSISELTKFLAPLVATLGRSERRRAATHYVEGLLIPGQRKSIEPLAVRVAVDSLLARAAAVRQRPSRSTEYTHRAVIGYSDSLPL